MRKEHYVFISCCVMGLALILVPLIALGMKIEAKNQTQIYAIPEHWQLAGYVEDYQAYEDSFAFDDIQWSTVEPETPEEFITVDPTADVPEAVFRFSADDLSSFNLDDRRIALLTEDEAWSYISNGLFTEYPTTSFNDNKDKLVQLQASNTKIISVKVWTWNSKNKEDLTKKSDILTVAVNTKLAPTFEHIFQDIYNHPDKPIINLYDSAMGTWVLRGKNHNNNRTMSSHALGCAIDINPSTGSAYVNGVWYGNAYGQKAMPTNIWYQLPETQEKYNILYKDSPIVETFKAYGFYWGGDWDSGTDCMHLAYIGDGSSARAKAIKNYEERH